MEDSAPPRGELNLPLFDILTLLESPPQNDNHAPTTPVKIHRDPIPRPSSSAGHTPRIRTSLRRRPISSSPPPPPPPRLAASHSVTFLSNPVSDIYIFDSPVRSDASEPTSAAESSPFVHFGDLNPQDGHSTGRWGSSITTTLRSGSSPTQHAPRRHSMPMQTLPLPPSRGTSVTGIARAPPSQSSSQSPSDPKPETSRRKSMDPSLEMKVSQSVFTSISSPTPAPIKRRSLFQRAQNITKSKIFGGSSTSGKANPSGGPAGGGEENAFPSMRCTSHHLDFHAKYRLVDGCITYDREIRALFEENGGLRRVWREEAILLFRKGDREGFELVVKRLQIVMTALAGRSVVFG